MVFTSVCLVWVGIMNNKPFKTYSFWSILSGSHFETVRVIFLINELDQDSQPKNVRANFCWNRLKRLITIMGHTYTHPDKRTSFLLYLSKRITRFARSFKSYYVYSKKHGIKNCLRYFKLFTIYINNTTEQFKLL